MKRTAWTTVAAIAVVVAAYSQYTRPFPEYQKPSTPDPHSSTGAGLVIHVDPATGDLIGEPSTIDIPNTVDESLNRSSEGLEQVPAPVGGGVMVDLQGRFQSTYVATIGADGDLDAECLDKSTDEVTAETDGHE